MSSIAAPKPVSAGALYYPYIHLEDNWLLANLLIFPCIKRMVPMGFTPPRDSLRVKALAERGHNKEPLLQRADLNTTRARRAQTNLANKLERDANDASFIKRYDQTAARALAKTRDYGFQIHMAKLSDDLKQALAGKRLAWNPVNKEPYAKRGEYVEVHPRVGQAVMSTLAIACAQDDGLDIVGDERSGDLHRCLLEKELNSVYESWLGIDTNMEPPPAASGEELMEFIVGMVGNPSKLSIDGLRSLAAEREPIDALIAEL